MQTKRVCLNVLRVQRGKNLLDILERCGTSLECVLESLALKLTRFAWPSTRDGHISAR